MQAGQNVVVGPYIAPPEPVVLSLHQLPPPPRDFTGRTTELTELMVALQGGSVTIIGLQGMGGIGKTALALVAAEQLTPHYPDAQFYLDLKGISPQSLPPSKAMAHVIHAYNPTAKLPEGEAELRGLYYSMLHGKRALLLMDNAREAAQVEPLIPPESCVLVVTSRQHFTLPGLFAKSLDVLSPPEACTMLLTIAPRIGDWAKEIAKLCGYLPLALRVAGSALAEQIDPSPADYTRRLADARQRLKLVDASLSLSYDLLNAAGQRLWSMLALFPDTFDGQAAAAVWGLDLDAAQDAIGKLVKYSLVEWNPSSARYRLHDLARLFADARLSAEERVIVQRRHAMHYKNIIAQAERIYLQGGASAMLGLALFDEEWTNIQAGQAWAEANADRDTIAAQLCNEYPNAGPNCLNLRLYPHERIRWGESALAAAQQLIDRVREGDHLGFLGWAYWGSGDLHRAIEYYEHSLLIAREISDRQKETGILNRLGLAYADLSDAHRAIELYEQALLIAREIGNRRMEGQILGNLGLTYSDLGDTRRAIELHEQALLIERETKSLRAEGNTLGNLSIAYMNLGDTRRAIEYGEQCLNILRTVGDRREEGRALGSLGGAYFALGDTRRAIELHEQAVVIAREVGDKLGEASGLDNLGARFTALGEPNRAIEYHEQALAIAREIGFQIGEGAALDNLGVAYAGLGEPNRAIEFYKQALVISHKIGFQIGEGAVLFHMSIAMDKLGDRARAIGYAEGALTIYEQMGVPEVTKVRKQLEEWRTDLR